MFTAKIENSNGQVLTLTQKESDYQVISITGLNPPPAQINTTNIAGIDGAKFNSAKLDTRNIVIMLKLNGDVEGNRLALYQMFRTKEACRFYYSNGRRDVSIPGYVETVECDLFTNAEIMQVSIICMYPYFRDVHENWIEISDGATAGFHFPFSINVGSPIPFSIYNIEGETNVENTAEAETGAIIRVDVNEPIRTIEIRNTGNNEFFKLEHDFQRADTILINTHKGEKSITLVRNGVASNVFTALKLGSTFFQLNVGNNFFTYFANGIQNDERLLVRFIFAAEYRGV